MGIWVVSSFCLDSLLLLFFIKILFIHFQRNGKGGRKQGRETLMCERHIDWLPLTHPEPGTRPATQACALTGNQTTDPLVRRPALNPLSHTSQGESVLFLEYLLGPNMLPSAFYIQNLSHPQCYDVREAPLCPSLMS